MITFLVLDFNKKEESFRLLKSLKLNAKFPHKVVFCSNGGRQDYVMDFYRDGLIDDLILNKKTIDRKDAIKQLFGFCQEQISIYVPNNQILLREFNQTELERIISMLGLGDYDNKSRFHEVKSIDLSGNGNPDLLIENAFLLRPRFFTNYLSFNTAPLNDYYKQNLLLHYKLENALFSQ